MVKLKLDLFLNPNGMRAKVSNSTQYARNLNARRGAYRDEITFDLADWLATKPGLAGLSGATWAGRKYKGDKPTDWGEIWRAMADDTNEWLGCGGGYVVGKRDVKQPILDSFLFLAGKPGGKALGLLLLWDERIFVNEFSFSRGAIPAGSQKGLILNGVWRGVGK